MNPLRYIKNVLKWLDIGVNVVLLASARVQTLSRRAGLARDAGKRWGCAVCRVLDWFKANHCTDSVHAGEIL